MSVALFKSTLKKNWRILLIFFAVLTMYTTIMISMYDPDDMQAITSMLELFPEDLMKAMGFSQMVNDLTSYLASWLYGLLMFGFPMVYCIILSNKLVAKKVDNGSFAFYLSTPNSRVKIIATLGIYAIASVVVLFAALFAVGVIFSEIMHPGFLDIDMYLRLNITTMLVNIVVVMIGFFFSCFFNDSAFSTGFGAGIPITMLLLNMLGGTSDDLSMLKNMTIYGWYDPVELVGGSSAWQYNSIYLILSVVLFISALIVFRRKKLPL